MNKTFVIASLILTIPLFGGCGDNDDENGSDVMISVDYGQKDTAVGIDSNIYPDYIVLTDDGTPADTNVKPDMFIPKDTTTPKDNNTGVDNNVADEGGEDTTISDFCTVPTQCAFETVQGMRDNCDGTFTDTNSGLMWQGVGVDHPLAAANTNMMARQCNTTKTGCNNGRYYEDWRVPTIDEVRSLIRGCADTAVGGSCPASESCYQMETCINSDCDGCGTGNGLFEYVDGEDVYMRYIDPRMTSEDYGVSYSTVMSGTNTSKTASDSRYRFFYVLNYNGKLGVLNPLQEATDGVLFCVRGGY